MTCIYASAKETGTTVNIPVCRDKAFNFVATFPDTVNALTNDKKDIKSELQDLKGNPVIFHA